MAGPHPARTLPAARAANCSACCGRPRRGRPPRIRRDLAYDSIVTRLRYLEEVGLGYLTLDRPSRTLSGGEVQRVNLTSCLGTSLVDTLFVLDEPSVGLHPRDVDRLIAIIRSLTAAGNTVIVVEHDETMIRAADHVVEVGPAPGEAGGRIVFAGSVPALLASPRSITGAYFSGRESIPVPGRRRPVDAGTALARLHRRHQAQPPAPVVPPAASAGWSASAGFPARASRRCSTRSSIRAS